jgi:hypothetical protein
MIVSSFVKDLLTEDDNNSVFCYVRVLSVLAGVVLLTLLIYKTINNPASFDIEAAGRGMLEYFGGVAAAIWGKTKSGA